MRPAVLAKRLSDELPKKNDANMISVLTLRYN
jgi:hypothetical protein